MIDIAHQLSLDTITIVAYIVDEFEKYASLFPRTATSDHRAHTDCIRDNLSGR